MTLKCELANATTPVRTIILTAAIEKAQVAAAIQLGARGVVPKDAARDVWLERIRNVIAGEYWVGREGVTDPVPVLRDRMGRPCARSRGKPFKLTARELEVIERIVAGYTNKDMAQRFSISERTVKHHLTSIFRKLGVSSRLELVLFAVHHEIV